MNTKAQGDIGVAMAIAYYTKAGYVVCVPFSDNARYDIIVEKDSIFFRVQCKTTRHLEKGSYVVQLRTSGGNQSWKGTSKKITADEVDLLFVYSFDGLWWEFPPNVFHGKSSLRLGNNKESYKVS